MGNAPELVSLTVSHHSTDEMTLAFTAQVNGVPYTFRLATEIVAADGQLALLLCDKTRGMTPVLRVQPAETTRESVRDMSPSPRIHEHFDNMRERRPRGGT